MSAYLPLYSCICIDIYLFICDVLCGGPEPEAYGVSESAAPVEQEHKEALCVPEATDGKNVSDAPER